MSPAELEQHHGNLNRTVRRIGTLLLLVLGGGLVLLAWLTRNQGKFSAGYGQVERGMSVVAVREKMGSVGEWREWREWRDETSEGVFAAWDEERLPEEEAKRIAGALSYRAWRPVIGVKYEFTFDVKGKVVGKHVYD